MKADTERQPDVVRCQRRRSLEALVTGGWGTCKVSLPHSSGTQPGWLTIGNVNTIPNHVGSAGFVPAEPFLYRLTPWTQHRRSGVIVVTSEEVSDVMMDQPLGVCFKGGDGKLYPMTTQWVTQWRSQMIIEEDCRQRARECVPRTHRVTGSVVNVQLVELEPKISR